jgi:Glyoxalase-like domain
MGPGPGRLTEVVLGDDPAAWASVGFAVGDDGTCPVGTVRLRLVGSGDPRGRGLVAWTLARPDTDTFGGGGETGAGTPDDGVLDGLPTTLAADAGSGLDGAAGAPGTGAHPNGVTHIDHVVVLTPDLDRTTAAIGALGIEARRTREAGPGRLQRFFRLGEAILELVGPVEPRGDGPARFYGLAFTVADLDATAAHLAGRISTPKAAVQPGRRIATLRAGDDVSVPVAFMSPDGRDSPPGPGGDP